MPAAAMVAVALVLAVVVGLIVGAVWGLAGSSSPPSAQPTGQAPTGGSASTAPSTPSQSRSPSPTRSSSAPAPSATGTVPAAPATTDTSSDGWRLGSWRITNDGGVLGVVTTARNTSTGARSADLVLYVYVGDQWIATTTARVTDVGAGETVPVTFVGTDPWKPGQKVLLLKAATD
jgi:cytoskeletal protein RodZ